MRVVELDDLSDSTEARCQVNFGFHIEKKKLLGAGHLVLTWTQVIVRNASGAVLA